jgi:pimeloyl-ACP methyl ester carboxylesterase
MLERIAGRRAWLALPALGLAAGLTLRRRFRRDMARIIAAVEAGGSIAETPGGRIEFGETGDGEPVLVVHGAGGGYDQGLTIGRELGEGFRVIAPSRFGYLRSELPPDPSPAAQADAHAALLDHLGVARCIVVGASAGAPSAIELALRHPERVTALILLVPRVYHPQATVGVDDRLPSRLVLRLVEGATDFGFWLATALARSSVVRFLGVPPEIEAHAAKADRARITALMRGILPLSRRAAGLAADAAASIGPRPLERVGAPTLIVSAEDDLFGTAPGARFTAAGIPGAELEILASGGHLMVGRGEQVRDRVRGFLARARARNALVAEPA